jgi:hypothetical protein
LGNYPCKSKNPNGSGVFKNRKLNVQPEIDMPNKDTKWFDLAVNNI